MATLPEERLRLRLGRSGDVLRSVEVVSHRAAGASRVLEGRTVAEVRKLCPLLFALCGRAQAEALERALDEAAERAPSPGERARRTLVVEVEAADQHLMAALVTWPQLVGEVPDMARYAAARAAAGRLTRAEGDAAALSTVAEPLLSLGRSLAPQALLDPSGAGLGRLADAVTRAGAQALGVHAAPRPLEAPDLAAHLRRRLDEAPGFAARPVDPSGRPAEVGPAVAHWEHPIIRAARARYGGGILTRWAARLVDLGLRLDRIEATIAGGLEPTSSATEPRDGAGLGLVDTARGLLAHRIVVEAGRVRRFVVLAPTEWNLHPEGPARALVGAPAPTAAAAERWGRWWLAALDPCVPVDCEVSG